MASTIGIKIANGEFYSILTENSVAKKRLVLTTVHDNQESVHIDLYNSKTATIQNALYIGRLVVEHIKSKSKGEASIELVISSNEHGEIIADAIDLDATGMAQHLQVSLTAPPVGLLEDVSSINTDFVLEHENAPPSALYDQPAKKKKTWLVLLIIGVALIILLFLLWFFLLRGKNATSDAQTAPTTPEVVVPLPAPSPVLPQPAPVEVPQEAPPASDTASLTPEVAEWVIEIPPEKTASETASKTLEEVEAPPVISAPVEAPPPAEPVVRTRRNPPVASYKVPTTIPRAGAPYRIRWGDTLWDISEAFYRNPWLYPRIARFNSIRNPDLIISGRIIRIPPRN
jgi:hypothetical protein